MNKGRHSRHGRKKVSCKGRKNKGRRGRGDWWKPSRYTSDEESDSDNGITEIEVDDSDIDAVSDSENDDESINETSGESNISEDDSADEDID